MISSGATLLLGTWIEEIVMVFKFPPYPVNAIGIVLDSLNHLLCLLTCLIAALCIGTEDTLLMIFVHIGDGVWP